MKPRLPPSAHIFWDLDKNVPLVGWRPPGNIIRVRATPPRDVRFMMGVDRRITEEAIIREYGDASLTSLLLPSDQLILLNKVPYVDAGDEIIVGGSVIGHRFYDPKGGHWRFKPLYEGVSRMIYEELGYYAIVNLPKLAPGFTIHRGHVVKSQLPDEKGKFVAVATKNDQYHAVARIIRNQRLYVLKSWKASPPRYINRPSTIRDAIRTNEHRLEMLSYKAELLIHDGLEKFRLPAFISFSGGKDSLVLAHISSERVGLSEAIFNDTGIELPETIENVEKVRESLGLDVIIASAGGKFFSSMHKLGPPARDYRWCCKVCKLAPIAKAIKDHYPGGVLSIVGQRKYESASRASIPVISRSRWIPNAIVIAPLNDWTALDVWMYIFKHGLKANTLYWQGLDRIGCWLCPACELAEFAIVQEVHPELWTPWEEFLTSWAKKHSLPQEWVRYGAWRWRRLPGDFKRFLDKEGIDQSKFNVPRAAIHVIVQSLERDQIIVRINGGVSLLRARELLKLLGGRIMVGRDGICVQDKEIAINVNKDGIVRICAPEDRLRQSASLVLTLLARANLCTRCGLCEIWCPKGAVKVEPDIQIDALKCNRCLLCNRACPVATYVLIGDYAKLSFSERASRIRGG
ncbi:MAG: phosphoadenosine phosphosulfate reductase family protein [Thermoprotei archaeon]|nr:phosphoadenosine phosphosulfate reductase family protein [Thermoprotei archaeon]